MGKKTNPMLRPHSYQPPEDGLPPKEVRILGLRAEPWPESDRRVRVYLDVTPFLERPNMEMTITSADGQPAASIQIIESIDAELTFTMHIRGEAPRSPYTLSAVVFYPDPEIGQVDQKSITFETADGPQEK